MKPLTALLIFLIPLALSASEIRTGIFFHDAGEIFGHTRRERGVDLGFEVLLGEGLFRPNLGATLNSQGHTSKIYWGGVIEPRLGRVFVSIGLGGALHSGEIHSHEEKSLGSKLLFRISGEVGIKLGRHSLSIILDHISNADFGEWNDGLDILGLRFGWKL